MVKVIGLYKKKAGMSDEEFRDYYETKHIPLFDEYTKMPGVKHYARRYLKPIATPIAGDVHSQTGYDVIMEVWCDEEFFEFFFVNQPPDEFRAMIAEDEAKFFARDEMEMYIADDVETDLAAHQAR